MAKCLIKQVLHLHAVVLLSTGTTLPLLKWDICFSWAYHGKIEVLRFPQIMTHITKECHILRLNSEKN